MQREQRQKEREREREGNRRVLREFDEAVRVVNSCSIPFPKEQRRQVKIEADEKLQAVREKRVQSKDVRSTFRLAT